MKQKIISEFYEKTKDVSALIFSQGSKLLNIEHCSMIPHQIEEGEFGDGFNIRIKGTGEFFRKEVDGITLSDGDGQRFEVRVVVENDEIIKIDKINLIESYLKMKKFHMKTDVI